MHGLFLLLPFLFIRYGLVNKAALKRAAHFAPLYGMENLAYWIYQIATIILLLSMMFLKVIISFAWYFYLGVMLYLFGLVLCAVSLIHFADPPDGKFNNNGLYRYSRNPIYVSYFLYFSGCAVLTQSLILGAAVLLFQIAGHWIILAEERWCMQEFGIAYQQYRKKTRRYL